MSTANKLTFLNQTKGKIKDSINLTGANLTNETFREYATVLKDTLAHLLKNPSPIWDNFPKTTGTGTAIQVNTYNSLFDYSLDGNTTQKGTPTPSTPIPFNVVTGLQKINITGSNLFNEEWELGSIDVHGNETSSTTSIRSVGYTEVEPNTTYRITRTKTGYYPVLREYNASKTFVSAQTIFSGHIQDTSITFTTTNDTYYIRLVDSESTDRNKIMLTKGTQVVSYEPYKGNTYEINLGKNLFNINAIDTTKINVSGIDKEFTLTQKNNNTNTPLPITFENNKTYTFSGYYSSTYANFSIRITYTDNSTSNIIGVFDNSSVSKTAFSFTSTSSKSISMVEFRIFGASVNLTLYDFQVEKGSQATSYSSYFTPIELNKIGNYKDYIFKGKGINLFDEDNLINNVFIHLTNGSDTTNANWKQSQFIKVKPSTTYIISNSISMAGSGYFEVSKYNSSQTWVSSAQVGTSGNKTQTFTTDNTTEYIKLGVYKLGTNTDNVMLNEGSTSLPYEPYNAKDKWLLHKEVGKYICTASDNWNTMSYGTNSWRLLNLITPLVEDSEILIMTTKFQGIAKNNRNTPNSVIYVDGSNLFSIINTPYTTKAEVQSGMSGQPVYYVLANPTTTEIENEELINDLERLELLDGLNNIAITGDLPAIMNLTCLEKE